ncbi:MAG TPA: large-conductance mechanosensitive channel protein MscL [Phnomibacter sp.]|nr:large-conductance mechanosensitive channel protein MscL [Phnomibacter sp.]
MSWIREFKEFASRGNLVDVAVAFVMGAAFGKIVTTFTEGIVSPIVTLLTGGVDFSKKEIILKAAKPVLDEAGNVTSEIAAVSLKYGALINAFVDFIIVAWAMFMVIKAINKMKKAQVAPPPPGPSSTDQLLMEIRDALKK